MSRNEKILKLVPKWVELIGRREAERRLTNRDLPASMADRICSGHYMATPRDLLARVLTEEMEKDGISLTDERAS